VSEIERELENASTSGDKNFVRSFDQSVARLHSFMECVETDARQLANSLKTVSGLAENISGRVSVLDVAKGRVVECLQRVGDLRELRTCAEGVEEALRREEYDEAASNIHRFLALDTAVFKMGDQVDAKDGGQSLKHSYEVLRKATATLKEIIEREFDKAVAADDVASMERYFKLFPLINEHASGLTRFGKYLSLKIEKLGDDNFKILQAGGTDDKRRNVIYADTLTMLFEGVARIIELHQPLIDNFYGPDKLLNLIGLLQTECDEQAIRVINAFIQSRQFEMKTRQVDSIVRGTERGPGKIDALELDVLLSEVTLMHTRAELYWRFLKRRVGDAPARPLSESHDDNGAPSRSISPKHSIVDDDVFVEELTEEEYRDAQEKVRQQRNERNQKLDALLNRSALGTKMQEILGKYVLMEQYYMTESVKKAIDMDDLEEGALTSSMLDDVFFIVRKSIRRSITSSSVDCVCAMLNNGVTLLETEFLQRINEPIKLGYPGVSWTAEAYQTAQIAAFNVIQQKNVAEAGPDKQRTAFLVALNNLRSAVDCVQTLKSGLMEDFTKHLNQINSVDKGKLEHSVGQFDDICKRLEHFSAQGIVKLCEAAFKPRLKSSAEAYLDLSHTISEDDLAQFEAVDPFIENFIAQMDKNIAHFESLLVTANYQDLISAICSETATQLERVVFKCVFNRLGGLQLDKELRQLTNYLTSIAGWSVRQKCSRLSQIVALLNSESIEEAVEFFQQLKTDSNTPSSLSISELKKVLNLRSDFPREKIKALKI
jgi:hypothetical protein